MTDDGKRAVNRELAEALGYLHRTMLSVSIDDNEGTFFSTIQAHVERAQRLLDLARIEEVG